MVEDLERGGGVGGKISLRSVSTFCQAVWLLPETYFSLLAFYKSSSPRGETAVSQLNCFWKMLKSTKK